MYKKTHSIIRGFCQNPQFKAQKVNFGTLSIPSEIIHYYSDFGPLSVEFEGPTNSFTFCSATQMEKMYKNHLFISSLFGFLKKKNPNWNEQWLPIAFEGSDPFIYNMNDAKIYYAIHDYNYKNPKVIFNNLLNMTLTISIIGDEYQKVENQFYEDEIKKIFLKDVEKRLLENAIAPFEVKRIIKILFP